MFFIKNIQLKHFKCYENVDFSFSPTKNIIYGANASGKTSLVEAIYYLAIGKSFKNIKDSDLIKKNNDFFYIKALVNNENGDNFISFAYDGRSKQVIKDEKAYKKLSDYLGYFKVVVFSPDDLALIKGAPGERRRFLDVNIGQIDKLYLDSLIKQRKLLKERNEYLKNNQTSVDNNFLDVLDDALIKESIIIIEKRQKFINSLNKIINNINKKLSSEQETLKIIYKPNTQSEHLSIKALDRRYRDISLGQTSWGPSRDDFSFMINNEDAEVFASQGQMRTAALSLKLALAELFKDKDNNMLVILDDVFSELDKTRQNAILKLLDLNHQTFITTTLIDHLDQELLNSSKLIQIRRKDNE